jgi:molecular chaperone GrpE
VAKDEDYLEPEEEMSPEPQPDSPPVREGPPLSHPPSVTSAEASEQKALLAEHRLAEVMAAYRKLKVDHEGFRERTARNLDRRFDQRVEHLLSKFIDVLDNFDRALEATEQTYAGEPLIEGLILVRTQLLQILQQEGLERIPVLGAPFDPHVAEAVGTQPTDDPDQHHLVAKEFQRGYRFRNHLVRPSRVIVLEYHGPGEREGKALDEDTRGRGVEIDLRASPQPADSTGDSLVESPVSDEAAEEDLSLDDIIARAEAQRALFPEAFDEPAPEVQAAIIPPDEEEEQGGDLGLIALSDEDEEETYGTLEEDDSLLDRDDDADRQEPE